MKYFDVPEQNAAFLRHIDILYQMIEKYGGNVVFPPEDEMKTRWENILQSIQENEDNNSLTTKPAA
jgi:hypothetical protein